MLGLDSYLHLSGTKNGSASGFLVAVTRQRQRLSRMEIGDRIKSWRRQRGLTQDELAQAVGVNKSAVGQWETTSEHRKGISTDHLMKVAAVLRVKVSTLTGDASDDTGMVITDPNETALVTVFRMMDAGQQDIHLRLFYVSAGLGDPAKTESHPTERKRVAS